MDFPLEIFNEIYSFLPYTYYRRFTLTDGAICQKGGYPGNTYNVNRNSFYCGIADRYGMDTTESIHVTIEQYEGYMTKTTVEYISLLCEGRFFKGTLCRDHQICIGKTLVKQRFVDFQNLEKRLAEQLECILYDYAKKINTQ